MSNEFQTILIAGATGALGQKITDAFLNKKQFEVRVVVRKESEKTEQLKVKGATVIEADFNDIESLKKATTGADAVISVLSDAGLALQPNLIEAAAATGVKRFIPSEFGGNPSYVPRGTAGWVDLKFAAREQIERLGLSYTYIFTNLWLDYAFSFFYGVDLKEGKANTYGPDTVFSAIHTDDIARLVPEVLLNPNSKNRAVNLAASVFKWDDALAQLERLSGKTLKRHAVTVEELNAALAQVTDPTVKFALSVQRNVVQRKSGALEPIDNLTDPYYAQFKPSVTINDHIALVAKQ